MSACLGALALLAGGCGLLDDDPDTMDLKELRELREEREEQEEGGSGWGSGETSSAESPAPDSLDSENIVFYRPENAPECPEITVGKWTGGTEKLKPVEEGKVVLIVMWGMRPARAQAAAVHAEQLARRYGGEGLSVLGLAAVKRENSDPLRQFINRHGFVYPTYQLRASALNTLADAAGRSPTDPPGIILVDRQGRLRFYQQDFTYTLGGSRRGAPMDQRIFENARAGRRVEDFVRKLLREGQSDTDLPRTMDSSSGSTPNAPQQNRRQ